MQPIPPLTGNYKTLPIGSLKPTTGEFENISLTKSASEPLTEENNQNDSSSESSFELLNASPQGLLISLPKKKTILLGGFITITKKKRDSTPSSSSTNSSKSDKEQEPAILLDKPLRERLDRYFKGNLEEFSFDALASLAPQARATLRSYCQSISEPNAKELIARIKAVQKERKNKALLEALASNDKAVLDSMCLNNETIIKTNKLFTRILNALNNNKVTPHQYKQLCGFCVQWIHENRGTSWLAKVEKTLQKIALLDASVKDILSTVSHLRAEPTQQSQFETRVKDSKSFDSLLSTLCKTPQTNSEVYTVAMNIAEDLRHYQAQLFLTIKPADLVNKWAKKPSSMKRMLEFQDSLRFFLADCVVRYSDLTERMRLIRFLLYLCKASADLGDFSSAAAIKGALANATVTRLKQTWSSLLAKGGMQELHDELESLFLSTTNEKNLREAIDTARKKYKNRIIPSIGIIMKDLEFADARGLAYDVKDGEPLYNLEKAKLYYDVVVRHLDPKAYWSGQVATYVPCCDLVSLCLEATKNNPNEEVRDDLRHKASIKLEPPLRLDSIATLAAP